MYNFIQCVFSCDKKTLNTQAYNSLKVFLQKWARLLKSKIKCWQYHTKALFHIVNNHGKIVETFDAIYYNYPHAYH